MANSLATQATNLIKKIRKLGLKVNATKTKAILFRGKKEITLKIDNTDITTEKSVKFLGVTLDKHSSYHQHIKDLAQKANQNTRIIHAMGKKGIGAPYEAKRTIYKNIVESSMTYGQEIYGQARKTTLNMLDKAQATALRAITGTSRFTNLEALQVATNIEPLEIKRLGARLKYWARVHANPDNPTNKTYEDPRNQISESKYRKIREKGKISAAWATRTEAKKLNINQKDIVLRKFDSAPWTLDKVEIDTILNKELSKKEDSASKLKAVTLEHINTVYPDHKKIYTDGSKKENAVGIGIYSNDMEIKINKKITNNSSIMTAELVAIREALNEIEKKAARKDKIVILTDSLAASISLQNHHKQQTRQDLTEEITNKIHILRHRKEITTQICWIPAHCGIEGNEKADKEAKEGLDSETKLNTGLGKKEIYSIIQKHKMEVWQKKWDGSAKGRKFHAIVPRIGKNKINFKKDNNKINRARLGAPTIEKIGKPCEYCQTSPYNIEHIIESCPAHIPTRNKLKQQCHESKSNFSTTNVLSPSAPYKITNLVQKILRGVGSPL